MSIKAGAGTNLGSVTLTKIQNVLKKIKEQSSKQEVDRLDGSKENKYVPNRGSDVERLVSQQGLYSRKPIPEKLVSCSVYPDYLFIDPEIERKQSDRGSGSYQSSIGSARGGTGLRFLQTRRRGFKSAQESVFPTWPISHSVPTIHALHLVGGDTTEYAEYNDLKILSNNDTPGIEESLFKNVTRFGIERINAKLQPHYKIQSIDHGFKLVWIDGADEPKELTEELCKDLFIQQTKGLNSKGREAEIFTVGFRSMLLVEHLLSSLEDQGVQVTAPKASRIRKWFDEEEGLLNGYIDFVNNAVQQRSEEKSSIIAPGVYFFGNKVLETEGLLVLNSKRHVNDGEGKKQESVKRGLEEYLYGKLEVLRQTIVNLDTDSEQLETLFRSLVQQYEFFSSCANNLREVNTTKAFKDALNWSQLPTYAQLAEDMRNIRLFGGTLEEKMTQQALLLQRKEELDSRYCIPDTNSFQNSFNLKGPQIQAMQKVFDIEHEELCKDIKDENTLYIQGLYNAAYKPLAQIDDETAKSYAEFILAINDRPKHHTDHIDGMLTKLKMYFYPFETELMSVRDLREKALGLDLANNGIRLVCNHLTAQLKHRQGLEDPRCKTFFQELKSAYILNSELCKRYKELDALKLDLDGTSSIVRQNKAIVLRQWDGDYAPTATTIQNLASLTATNISTFLSENARKTIINESVKQKIKTIINERVKQEIKSFGREFFVHNSFNREELIKTTINELVKQEIKSFARELLVYNSLNPGDLLTIGEALKIAFTWSGVINEDIYGKVVQDPTIQAVIKLLNVGTGDVASGTILDSFVAHLEQQSSKIRIEQLKEQFNALVAKAKRLEIKKNSAFDVLITSNLLRFDSSMLPKISVERNRGGTQEIDIKALGEHGPLYLELRIRVLEWLLEVSNDYVGNTIVDVARRIKSDMGIGGINLLNSSEIKRGEVSPELSSFLAKLLKCYQSLDTTLRGLTISKAELFGYVDEMGKKVTEAVGSKVGATNISSKKCEILNDVFIKDIKSDSAVNEAIRRVFREIVDQPQLWHEDTTYSIPKRPKVLDEAHLTEAQKAIKTKIWHFCRKKTEFISPEWIIECVKTSPDISRLPLFNQFKPKDQCYLLSLAYEYCAVTVLKENLRDTIFIERFTSSGWAEFKVPELGDTDVKAQMKVIAESIRMATMGGAEPVLFTKHQGEWINTFRQLTPGVYIELTAPTGSGKSHAISKVSRLLGGPVLIISPIAVDGVTEFTSGEVLNGTDTRWMKPTAFIEYIQSPSGKNVENYHTIYDECDMPIYEIIRTEVSRLQLQVKSCGLSGTNNVVVRMLEAIGALSKFILASRKREEDLAMQATNPRGLLDTNSVEEITSEEDLAELKAEAMRKISSVLTVFKQMKKIIYNDKVQVKRFSQTDNPVNDLLEKIQFALGLPIDEKKSHLVENFGCRFVPEGSPQVGRPTEEGTVRIDIPSLRQMVTRQLQNHAGLDFCVIAYMHPNTGIKQYEKIYRDGRKEEPITSPTVSKGQKKTPEDQLALQLECPVLCFYPEFYDRGADFKALSNESNVASMSIRGKGDLSALIQMIGRLRTLSDVLPQIPIIINWLEKQGSVVDASGSILKLGASLTDTRVSLLEVDSISSSNTAVLALMHEMIHELRVTAEKISKKEIEKSLNQELVKNITPGFFEWIRLKSEELVQQVGDSDLVSKAIDGLEGGVVVHDLAVSIKIIKEKIAEGTLELFDGVKVLTAGDIENAALLTRGFWEEVFRHAWETSVSTKFQASIKAYAEKNLLAAQENTTMVAFMAKLKDVIRPEHYREMVNGNYDVFYAFCVDLSKDGFLSNRPGYKRSYKDFWLSQVARRKWDSTAKSQKSLHSTVEYDPGKGVVSPRERLKKRLAALGFDEGLISALGLSSEALREGFFRRMPEDFRVEFEAELRKTIHTGVEFELKNFYDELNPLMCLEWPGSGREPAKNAFLKGPRYDLAMQVWAKVIDPDFLDGFKKLLNAEKLVQLSQSEAPIALKKPMLRCMSKHELDEAIPTPTAEVAPLEVVYDTLPAFEKFHDEQYPIYMNQDISISVLNYWLAQLTANDFSLTLDKMEPFFMKQLQTLLEFIEDNKEEYGGIPDKKKHSGKRSLGKRSSQAEGNPKLMALINKYCGVVSEHSSSEITETSCREILERIQSERKAP